MIIFNYYKLKKYDFLQSIRAIAILDYFSLIDSISFARRTLVYCIDTIFAITSASHTSLSGFIIKISFNTRNTIESIVTAVARRSARNTSLIFWSVNF
jgi:phosphopantetheine adenylyltransferase